jgi:putative ABC transport system ATP-binding protein
MTAILTAQGLGKQYRMGEVTVNALYNIDFVVQAGEFVAIMGPSGSGKSTLLHLLGGLDEPTSGSVSLNGNRYDRMTDDDLTILRRQQIGFVFQFFNLIPTLTAAENVALPPLIDSQPFDSYQARVAELLDMVGLGSRRDHRPGQLSGGEQQRVAIARALVTDPAILLADEPTGNLDSAAGQTVLELLHRAHSERQQTIVMVTHDAHAATYADRVVYLRDGAIVRELAGSDLLLDGRRRTQEIRAVMDDLEA